MALFRRPRSSIGDGRTGPAVTRFWSWWDVARTHLDGAADADDRGALGTLLDARVRDVHPDLTWTVTAGARSAHMLVLSGGRHPALRSVTERWYRAGPAPDPRWEFHPAAPAEPAAFSARVVVGGLDLDPARAVAGVRADDRRYRLDVSVHHPAFAELGAPAAGRVAEVLVGWALGEDEIDRWIGRIVSTDLPPLDSVPLSMLGAVTAQLHDRWGGERWAVLEGAFGDRRLIAAVRHPLHRVDHPLLDEHPAVRLPYADALPDGLPGEQALGDLLAFESALVSQLGPAALLVAQQTTSGERLLHLYVDSAASPLEAVRAMLGGYLGALGTVTAQFDPGWQAIEHLRG